MRGTILGLFFAAACVDAQPRSDLGFQPLEVYSFKDGTRDLAVADLNGDGVAEVLFINNRQSRLEILYRKKTPGDAGTAGPLRGRFDNRGLVADQTLFRFRIADADADGLQDLLVFGGELGFQIYRQRSGDTFAQPEKIHLSKFSDVVDIAFSDLDADGLPDIAAAARDRTIVLWNAAREPFLRQSEYIHADETATRLETADVNADGRPDLLVHCSQGFPLRVRLNEGRREWSFEHGVQLPLYRSETVWPAARRTEADTLAVVLKDGINCRRYAFAPAAAPALFSQREAGGLRIPLGGTARKHAYWVAGDLDGTAGDDLLVTTPEASQLLLYKGGADGLLPAPHPIDTLSEVDSIGRAGNGDILAISRREKAAAIHRKGRLAEFPDMLQVPGEVVAGAASETGPGYFWLVTRATNEAFRCLQLDATGGVLRTLPLDLSGAPETLRVLESEGRTQLWLFMPYEPPVVLNVDGPRAERITGARLRALTAALKPGQLAMGGKGRMRTLCAAEGRVARVYTGTNGAYEVAAQINPGSARTELSAVCEYSPPGGSPGWLLFDKNTGDLVFAAGTNDLQRVHIAGSPMEVQGLAVLRGASGRLTVALLGPRDVALVGEGLPQLKPVSTGEYTTRLEDASVRGVFRVALGCPPRPMIALTDVANRSIELVASQTNALVHEMAFEVFQDSGFNRRRETDRIEPHDVASGDVTGDKIPDLVVLVHDKLILYPGAVVAAGKP